MSITIEQAQKELELILMRAEPGEEITIVLADGTRATLRKESGRGKRRGAGFARGILTIVADDDEHLKDFAEHM